MSYKKEQELFLAVQNLISKSKDAKVLGEEEAIAILKKYDLKLVRPKNIFRILFFVLSAFLSTAIILLFDENENDIATPFIFGVIFWITGDLLIRKLKLLRSGIEEGFLVVSSICLYAALHNYFLGEGKEILQPNLILFQLMFITIILFKAIRYRSWIFIYTTFIYFFYIIFTTSFWFFENEHVLAYKLGFAVFSILIFIAAGKERFRQDIILKPIFFKLVYLAMIAFYLSFDPFITKQLYFDFNADPERLQNINLLFPLDLIASCMIPFLYIIMGVFKKERAFINVGVGCLALTLFSVWYFFLKDYENQNLLVLSIGFIMLITGLILHFLLKKPKANFVSHKIEGQEPFKIVKPLMNWGKRFKNQ